TAIVRPPACSAPWCARLSTPRARPLTTVKPYWASSALRRWAASWPYGLGFRDPTTATARLSRAGASPRYRALEVVQGSSVVPQDSRPLPGSLHESLWSADVLSRGQKHAPAAPPQASL